MTVGARFERITSRNTHNATTGTKKRTDSVFDTSVSKRYTDMGEGKADYLRIRGGAGNPCLTMVDMVIPDNPSFGDFVIEDYKLGLYAKYISTESLEKPILNTYLLHQPLGDNEGNAELGDVDVVCFFSGLDSSPDKHYSTDFTTYPSHRLPEGAEENIVRTSGQITKQSDPYISAADAFKYNASKLRQWARAGGMKGIAAGIQDFFTGGGQRPTANARQLSQGYGDANGHIPLIKSGDVYKPALERYGSTHWRIDDPHWEVSTLAGAGLPKYYTSQSMSSTHADGGGEELEVVKTTDSIFTKIRNTTKVHSSLTRNLAFSQINYSTTALTGKALRMYTSIGYDSEGEGMTIDGEVLGNVKSERDDAELETTHPTTTGGYTDGSGAAENLNEFEDLHSRAKPTQGAVTTTLITTDGQPTLDFGLDQNRRQDIFVTSEVPVPVRWSWDRAPVQTGTGSWGAGSGDARLDTRDSNGNLTCKTELDIDLLIENLEPVYKDVDETVVAHVTKARRCIAITFSENEPGETDSLPKFVKTQMGTGSATDFQYNFSGIMLTKSGTEGQGINLTKFHPHSAFANSIQVKTGSTKPINGHNHDELIPQTTPLTTAIPSGEWLRFKFLTDPESATGGGTAIMSAGNAKWFTLTICDPDTDDVITTIHDGQIELYNCNVSATTHTASGNAAANYNFTHFPKYMTIWVCNWPSQMHSSNGGEPLWDGSQDSPGYAAVSGSYDQTFTPPDRWNGLNTHMPPHRPNNNPYTIPGMSADVWGYWGPGRGSGKPGPTLADWDFSHNKISTGYSQTLADLNDEHIAAPPTRSQTGAPAGSGGLGRFGEWQTNGGVAGPKVYLTHKEEYQLNNRAVTNELLVDAINWKRVNTSKVNLSAVDSNTDTLNSLQTLKNNKSPVVYNTTDDKLDRTATPHYISFGFRDRDEIDFSTNKVGMFLWNGFSMLDAFTPSPLADADIAGCIPIYWPKNADGGNDGYGPISIPHNLGDTGGLLLHTNHEDSGNIIGPGDPPVSDPTLYTHFSGRYTQAFNTLDISEVANTTATNSGSLFFSSYESTYPRMQVTRSNSETGICQSLSQANSSRVRLASSSNPNPDYYNGLIITITGGTGAGQSRKITDYVATGATEGSRLATIANAWVTTPDATSTYSIDVCPQAIQNFTQKGYSRLMDGSNDFMTKWWAKRENIYCSARITKIVKVSSNSVELEFDDYDIFETLTDEEYIAFVYMGEYVDSVSSTTYRANRIDTDTIAGDAGWCAPMVISKKDERTITFSCKTHASHALGTGSNLSGGAETGLFLDDGAIDSVARLTHLFKDGNIGKLFLSPYRHWAILQLRTDDGVNASATSTRTDYETRGYTGVVPIKGSNNDIYPSLAGVTHNESLFYTSNDDTAAVSAGGRTVDNLYHNSWDLNVNDPESSIAKLTVDYGFGEWDEEALIGGNAAKTAIFDGWNYIALEKIQEIEKFEQGDTISLMIMPADVNKQNDIGFYSSEYSTDTSLRPRLITRYIDVLPKVPTDFKVIPSKDNSYNPVFTWTVEDKDIWYGLIMVDDSMIYNQYHGAVRWIPMNEGLETDSCRSFNVSTGDQVGTAAFAINNITDNLEGLAGHNKTFNGTNSYLKYGDGTADATLDCTSLMSIVAHVIPNPSGSDVRRIISQMDSGGQKFDIWLDADNQIRAQVYYSDTEYVELNSTPIMADGETPTNVILTVDTKIREGNVKLFLNGKLSDITGRAKTTPIVTSYNNWKTGSNINSGNSALFVGNGLAALNTAFDGELEEMVIYNKLIFPVTPQDNKFIFNKPLTDMTTALYSSSIGYVGRLFIKDFHNIRGTGSTDVTASSPITFRRASFIMDSRD